MAAVEMEEEITNKVEDKKICEKEYFLKKEEYVQQIAARFSQYGAVEEEKKYYVAPILLGVLAVIAFILGVAVPSFAKIKSYLLIGALDAGLIGLLLLFWLVPMLVKRRAGRAYEQNSVLIYRSQQTSIALYEYHVEYRLGEKNESFLWKDMTGIYETPLAVILLCDKNNIIVIPVRLFREEKILYQKLTEQLKSYYQKSYRVYKGL